MKHFKTAGLLLLCLLLLAGCGGRPLPTEESTTLPPTEPTTESVTTEIITEPPTEAPSLNTTEPVISLYDEEIEQEDGRTYSFQVPQLNGTGADVEAVNEELRALLEPIVETVRSGETHDCVAIYYSQITYKNILALVVSRQYYNGPLRTMVYNFSLSNGLRLTNDELLARVDVSKENFDAMAKVRAEEVFRELYEEAWQDEDGFEEALSQTLSPEYVHHDMPMYILDGKILLISPIFSPDGSGSTDKVYFYEKKFIVA